MTIEDSVYRPQGAARYGRFYWCVKVAKGISEEGEIYVMADVVRVLPDGSLAFIRNSRVNDQGEYEPLVREGSPLPVEEFNLLLAPGKWIVLYTASVFDGSAIAVDRWKGEVLP